MAKYHELKHELAEKLAIKTPKLRAARLLGIAESTVYVWEKKEEFQSILAQKEQEYRESLRKGIFDAGVKGSWQAFAWLAERQFPEEFPNPTQKVQHTGDDTAPLRILFGDTEIEKED